VTLEFGDKVTIRHTSKITGEVVGFDYDGLVIVRQDNNGETMGFPPKRLLRKENNAV